MFRVSHPPIIRSFKMHKHIWYNSRLCNNNIICRKLVYNLVIAEPTIVPYLLVHFEALDDGWMWHPKHVEQEQNDKWNKHLNCCIKVGILFINLWCTEPWNWKAVHMSKFASPLSNSFPAWSRAFLNLVLSQTIKKLPILYLACGFITVHIKACGLNSVYGVTPYFCQQGRD